MIFPDKLVTFQESVLAKCTYILKELDTQSMPASELFISVKDHYEDISEFILALDVLHMLNKIYFNEELKVMEYVRADKV